MRMSRQFASPQHTDAHTKKGTCIQSQRPWGKQSTQCLVKGREEDVENTAERSEYLFVYDTVQNSDPVSTYSITRLCHHPVQTGYSSHLASESDSGDCL